jgi:hypothetical protein
MGLYGWRASRPNLAPLVIAGISLGVLALVAVVAVWRRALGSQAERHSIHSYEHALDVLGDVSKRSDSSASVRVVPPEEASRSHIRPADSDAGHAPGLLPPPAQHEPMLHPRIKLQPPTAPSPAESSRRSGQHSEPRSAAGVRRGPSKSAQGPAQPPVPGAPPAPAGRNGTEDPRHAGAGTGPTRAARARGDHRGRDDRARLARQARARRVAVGGLAAVAIAVATLGLLQLLDKGKTNSATPPPTTTHPRVTSPPTSTTSPPTTTTTPKIIPPQSVSAADVSYVLPANSYTFDFSTSGPCWVGIQQDAAGPYVWEETLYPGQSASYRATGSTVVRLGAPTAIHISVNGVAVQLAASNTQPYDLTFTPGT